MEKKKKFEASAGYVIVQVLKDYPGMTKDLKKNDIIEVPERQVAPWNSLIKRGYVKLYTKGDKKPMHR